MPLVIRDFAELWDTAGKTSCLTSGCTVRLIQSLLPAESFSANSGYMGMWLIIATATLLSGLFLLETILNGGDLGGAHKAHG